ncbi:MAG: ATP-binding cassette domain-containing protein [Nitrososphaerota archaeon]
MIEIFNLMMKVEDFKIEVKEMVVNNGEYAVLMGPSGTGKTILLETIAGFRTPIKGEIKINGKNVTNLPPDKRNISYVPQDYALWPHMNVYENIAYGLKLKKVEKKEIHRKVLEIAEVMEIKDLLNRYPLTLSGGEKQRVALARALIIDPEVILLDEPLSNLDTKTKNQIKDFIIYLHKKLGFTAIHVTHDPLEAIELGNKIAIIINGKVLQAGTPIEIFSNPKNLEVAWLHGKPNIIIGEIIEIKEGIAIIKIEDLKIAAIYEKEPILGSKVMAILRPEDIVLSKESLKTSARNVIECIIKEVNEKGGLINIKLEHNSFIIEALITKGSYEDLKLFPGEKVYASFKASAIKILTMK